MDTTALNELIAQVRGTVTALAEAESKLTAVKIEMSDQEYKARLAASSVLLNDIAPLPKAASSDGCRAMDDGQPLEASLL